ncbi:hypothetical protein AXG93_3507s1070 [Marchantia polymorpha subsp. ruderalis]|uniref:Uncharacterized protein n=1 Tax=Marchantia polymorpha subsp. ruderalis TaxID=1480154 RepID=A0A176VHG5_MARPO|nr:hypothetical protein AXG93_3507s1070 [Marchantia polymorpha subsp. ruderalis]
MPTVQSGYREFETEVRWKSSEANATTTGSIAWDGGQMNSGHVNPGLETHVTAGLAGAMSAGRSPCHQCACGSSSRQEGALGGMLCAPSRYKNRGARFFEKRRGAGIRDVTQSGPVLGLGASQRRARAELELRPLLVIRLHVSDVANRPGVCTLSRKRPGSRSDQSLMNTEALLQGVVKGVSKAEKVASGSPVGHTEPPGGTLCCSEFIPLACTSPGDEMSQLFVELIALLPGAKQETKQLSGALYRSFT